MNVGYLLVIRGGQRDKAAVRKASNATNRRAVEVGNCVHLAGFNVHPPSFRLAFDAVHGASDDEAILTNPSVASELLTWAEFKVSRVLG